MDKLPGRVDLSVSQEIEGARLRSESAEAPAVSSSIAQGDAFVDARPSTLARAASLLTHTPPQERDSILGALGRLETQGRSYYTLNHAEALLNMSKADLNKPAYNAALKTLSDNGVLKDLPRAPIAVFDGTLTHYRAEEGSAKAGFGSAAIDNNVPNLALYQSTSGDAPAVLRHGKTLQESQWTAVRKVASSSISDAMRKRIQDGDALAVSIDRIDQKTPSALLNARENQMGQSESYQAELSNRAHPELARVHYSALTANGLATIGGGWLHSALIRGGENERNQDALANKSVRGLIEMARAETAAGKSFQGLSADDVRGLSKAFNQSENPQTSSDAHAFARYLRDQSSRLSYGDKYAFYQLLEHARSGDQLAQVENALAKLAPSTGTSKAIQNLLQGILSQKDTQGQALSRSEQLGLLTALDTHINMIADAGCKSGLDRTTHLFATTLANRELQRDHGAEATSQFLRNFAAIADAYDAHSKEFAKLAQGQGKTTKQLEAMLNDYRAAYLKTAVEVGLPITEYSTLFPGLKWHGDKKTLASQLSANRLPVRYLPSEIDVGGKKMALMQGSGAARDFTDTGNRLLKGLSRFRST